MAKAKKAIQVKSVKAKPSMKVMKAMKLTKLAMPAMKAPMKQAIMKKPASETKTATIKVPMIDSGLSSWAVELLALSPALGQDNFFRMKIDQIERTWSLWENWGGTGGDDQSSVQAFSTLALAQRRFREQFRSKTGNNFGRAFVAKEKKYKLVQNDELGAAPKPAAGQWQYYLPRGDIGWHNYPKQKNMEMLWKQSNCDGSLCIRVAWAPGNRFQNVLDFSKMELRRHPTGVRLAIRRVPHGERCSNEPPRHIPDAMANEHVGGGVA
ncbi:unnamed protein product [Polarella glacialis]|uniref:WGR domain-containing protein n=1 Tax=Polarella glacialis TaxID=89957 RepID=A0A813GPD5_POLGL|nr:unnamed protein product [Polarella glacialis]